MTFLNDLAVQLHEKVMLLSSAVADADNMHVTNSKKLLMLSAIEQLLPRLPKCEIMIVQKKIEGLCLHMLKQSPPYLLRRPIASVLILLIKSGEIPFNSLLSSLLASTMETKDVHESAARLSVLAEILANTKPSNHHLNEVFSIATKHARNNEPVVRENACKVALKILHCAPPATVVEFVRSVLVRILSSDRSPQVRIAAAECTTAALESVPSSVCDTLLGLFLKPVVVANWPFFPQSVGPDARNAYANGLATSLASLCILGGVQGVPIRDFHGALTWLSGLCVKYVSACHGIVSVMIRFATRAASPVPTTASPFPDAESLWQKLGSILISEISQISSEAALQGLKFCLSRCTGEAAAIRWFEIVAQPILINPKQYSYAEHAAALQLVTPQVGARIGGSSCRLLELLPSANPGLLPSAAHALAVVAQPSIIPVLLNLITVNHAELQGLASITRKPEVADPFLKVIWGNAFGLVSVLCQARESSLPSHDITAAVLAAASALVEDGPLSWRKRNAGFLLLEGAMYGGKDALVGRLSLIFGLWKFVLCDSLPPAAQAPSTTAAAAVHAALNFAEELGDAYGRLTGQSLLTQGNHSSVPACFFALRSVKAFIKEVSSSKLLANDGPQPRLLRVLIGMLRNALKIAAASIAVSPGKSNPSSPLASQAVAAGVNVVTAGVNAMSAGVHAIGGNYILSDELPVNRETAAVLIRQTVYECVLEISARPEFNFAEIGDAGVGLREDLAKSLIKEIGTCSCSAAEIFHKVSGCSLGPSDLGDEEDPGLGHIFATTQTTPSDVLTSSLAFKSPSPQPLLVLPTGEVHLCVVPAVLLLGTVANTADSEILLDRYVESLKSGKTPQTIPAVQYGSALLMVLRRKPEFQITAEKLFGVLPAFKEGVLRRLHSRLVGALISIGNAEASQLVLNTWAIHVDPRIRSAAAVAIAEVLERNLETELLTNALLKLGKELAQPVRSTALAVLPLVINEPWVGKLAHAHALADAYPSDTVLQAVARLLPARSGNTGALWSELRFFPAAQKLVADSINFSRSSGIPSATPSTGDRFFFDAPLSVAIDNMGAQFCIDLLHEPGVKLVTRLSALEALTHLSPPSRDLLGFLARLYDTEPESRKETLQLMRSISIAVSDAVSSLLSALKESQLVDKTPIVVEDSSEDEEGEEAKNAVKVGNVNRTQSYSLGLMGRAAVVQCLADRLKRAPPGSELSKEDQHAFAFAHSEAALHAQKGVKTHHHVHAMVSAACGAASPDHQNQSVWLAGAALLHQILVRFGPERVEHGGEEEALLLQFDAEISAAIRRGLKVTGTYQTCPSCAATGAVCIASALVPSAAIQMLAVESASISLKEGISLAPGKMLELLANPLLTPTGWSEPLPFLKDSGLNEREAAEGYYARLAAVSDIALRAAVSGAKDVFGSLGMDPRDATSSHPVPFFVIQVVRSAIDAAMVVEQKLNQVTSYTPFSFAISDLPTVSPAVIETLLPGAVQGLAAILLLGADTGVTQVDVCCLACGLLEKLTPISFSPAVVQACAALLSSCEDKLGRRLIRVVSEKLIGGFIGSGNQLDMLQAAQGFLEKIAGNAPASLVYKLANLSRSRSSKVWCVLAEAGVSPRALNRLELPSDSDLAECLDHIGVPIILLWMEKLGMQITESAKHLCSRDHRTDSQVAEQSIARNLRLLVSCMSKVRSRGSSTEIAQAREVVEFVIGKVLLNRGTPKVLAAASAAISILAQSLDMFGLVLAAMEVGQWLPLLTAIETHKPAAEFLIGVLPDIPPRLDVPAGLMLMKFASTNKEVFKRMVSRMSEVSKAKVERLVRLAVGEQTSGAISLKSHF